MKTGVIGLGAMGAGMALNLDKAGHLTAIWNRTPSKAEELAQQSSAIACDSIAELAAQCELIIICVSRDEDVLEVIQQLLDTVQKDSIVADTSTVSAKTAQKAAAMLQPVGAHFLDCPVSGGVEGARNGTLAMMTGGDEAILERARSTLSAMAASITLIGPTGSGQACKAVKSDRLPETTSRSTSQRPEPRCSGRSNMASSMMDSVTARRAPNRRSPAPGPTRRRRSCR